MKTLKDFYNKLLVEEKRLSTDSIDDQIDSLLLGYQSNSVVEDNQMENTLRSLTPLLLEQLPEEEEPEEEEPPVPGEEERPEDVMGSEDIATDEAAEEQVPKVDLDIFAQKVTNLADNFENLLDIKTVIINRAMNVLREKYGEDVIEEFTDILDREFGMGLEFDSNEEPERPLGGNAGPSPA